MTWKFIKCSQRWTLINNSTFQVRKGTLERWGDLVDSLLSLSLSRYQTKVMQREDEFAQLPVQECSPSRRGSDGRSLRRQLPDAIPAKSAFVSTPLQQWGTDQGSVHCFHEPVSKARQSWGSGIHHCPPQRLQAEIEARTGKSQAGLWLRHHPKMRFLNSRGLFLSWPVLDPAVLRSRCPQEQNKAKCVCFLKLDNSQAVWPWPSDPPCLSSGGNLMYSE